MDTPLLHQLLEAFQYGFMQRAFLVGAFISVCCALLGVFLVLKRFSMIGDGLAHFAFATVGLALLLDLYPLYVAVPLVVAASLLILRLPEQTALYGDAAIGIVSALGIAGGVMMASLGHGFNVDLFSYLFGDILAVTTSEVVLSVLLSAMVIGAILLFYHELFAVTFDGEYAGVLGIRVGQMNRLLAVLTAFTVVLGIKVVGTMLVSSLLVLPAVTALQVSRSFRLALLVSAACGLLSVVAGIVLAFLLDLPAGAAIVLTNFALFLLACAASRLRLVR
jgi:zinc transport system permease protein